MIDRGARIHAISADIAVGPHHAALPAAVEQNIEAWGGDIPLARALMHGVTDTRPAVLALAAWRAGAVRLRASAVDTALALLRSDSAALVPLASVLRVPGHEVESTLAALQGSPFAWPDAPVETAARIGGFIGLGGPFLTPVREIRELDRPDHFAVLTDTGVFALTVDIAGHRFAPIAEAPAGAVTARIAADGYVLSVRGDV